MSSGENSLENLRREIDSLDDQIHDLIASRFALADKISQVKRSSESGRPAIRPGREAAILRRIIERRDAGIPRAVVARVWREMIAAICRVQAPLRVAVCAPEKSVGFWDLARSHYGSSTPMTLHHSSQLVLRMVSEDPTILGILPAPQQGEEKPWWQHLVTKVENAPKIIARLPFIEDTGGRFEDLNAVVVARIDPEPSGDDISLIASIADEEISRARLREVLDSAGFEGQKANIVSHQSEGAAWIHMIEVDDFVAASDPRLSSLESKGRGSIRGVMSLGAYAKQIQQTNP